MDPALGAFGLAFLALILSTLHQRRERAASRSLATEQRAALGQLAEEVTSLREALAHSGAVAGPAKPPPIVPKTVPLVKREVVTVTRDDDPIHTRPTVESPPPAGEACSADEPPPTKPSQSRKIPASAAPGSAPRPVPFEDQIARAMKRIERQARVPPEVEARWEARLRALGAELGLAENAEPTEAQIDTIVRELYQAEADVKDARDAAPADPQVPAAEATLPSVVAPIAVRIALAARHGPDADGDATLRDERARPTVLPRANVDEDLDVEGRDTAEDMTRVYSRRPGEADAALPGVEVKPKPETVRPPPHKPPRPLGDPLAGVKPERPTSSPTRTAEEFPVRRARPTLLGGLGGSRAPQSGDQEGGDGR